MEIRFVKRQDIINSILDDISNGKEMTEEIKKLLNDLGKDLK